MEELGKTVRRLRMERHMTQQQLMDKAHLTRSQVYYIENCIRIPQQKTLMHICEALDITIKQFVEAQYNSFSSTPSISSMDDPGATMG